MCHDINPLGTTMHLRELDRRAARCRGGLRSSFAGGSDSRPALIRRLWEHAQVTCGFFGLGRGGAGLHPSSFTHPSREIQSA